MGSMMGIFLLVFGIMFAFAIGGFIFKIIKQKGNGTNIIGPVITALGFIGMFVFMIINIMNGPSFSLMFIPFICFFVAFIGVVLTIATNKKGNSSVNKTVKKDDNGNYIFNDDEK